MTQAIRNALTSGFVAADTGYSASATGPLGPGVMGLSSDGASVGFLGATGVGAGASSGKSPNCAGLLAGTDPVFSQEVGAYGQSDQQGVMGIATTNGGTGVYGGGNVADREFNGTGVRGESFNGTGIQGRSFGPDGWAGRFIGNVGVSGDVVVGNNGEVRVQGNVVVGNELILAGADCAEQFDVVTDTRPKPGTVLVIRAEGALCESQDPYDAKVAGVVSGGGDYRPAMVLDRHDPVGTGRVAVALIGKVYCKVDADYGPIELGDLLTTSSTPGHAMRATDRVRAVGAVVGKALRAMHGGQGLIPILVALQ